MTYSNRNIFIVLFASFCSMTSLYSGNSIEFINFIQQRQFDAALALMQQKEKPLLSAEQTKQCIGLLHHAYEDLQDQLINTLIHDRLLLSYFGTVMWMISLVNYIKHLKPYLLMTTAILGMPILTQYFLLKISPLEADQQTIKKILRIFEGNYDQKLSF